MFLLDTYVQTCLVPPSIFSGGAVVKTTLVSPEGCKGEARVGGVSLDLAGEILVVLSLYEDLPPELFFFGLVDSHSCPCLQLKEFCERKRHV